MGVSSGTMKVGVAAILVGLAGAYLLRVYLTPEEAPAASAPATVTVPLASADLPIGRKIAIGDMGLMPMTREEMESRGYDLSVVMLSPEQLAGRILKEPVRQGQPFLTTSFYLEGAGPNPLDRLKPGYRAVDVTIPNTRGGNVEPGTFVDVLFRSNPVGPEGNEPAIPEVTITLASGLEVIGVERPQVTALQATYGYVSKEPTVTLAASPEDARIFQTVMGRGDITLVARAPGEAAFASLDSNQPMTFRELLGIEPQPQPIDFTTVIYRRGSPSAQTFQYANPASQRVAKPMLMPSAGDDSQPSVGGSSPISSDTAVGAP